MCATNVALTESEIATLGAGHVMSASRDGSGSSACGASSRGRAFISGFEAFARMQHTSAEYWIVGGRSRGRSLKALAPSSESRPRPFSWRAAARRGAPDAPAVRCARAPEPSRIRWRGVRGSHGGWSASDLPRSRRARPAGHGRDWFQSSGAEASPGRFRTWRPRWTRSADHASARIAMGNAARIRVGENASTPACCENSSGAGTRR